MVYRARRVDGVNWVGPPAPPRLTASSPAAGTNRDVTERRRLLRGEGMGEVQARRSGQARASSKPGGTGCKLARPSHRSDTLLQPIRRGHDIAHPPACHSPWRLRDWNGPARQRSSHRL